MRKKNTNYQIIFAIILLTAFSFSNPIYSYEAGIPLTLNYTAEQSALSAVTAFDYGINGILYNPAIARFEKFDRNFISSYISLPQDVNIYYLAFSKEFKKNRNARYSVFAAGIDGGSVKQTLINGRDLEYAGRSSKYSAVQFGLSASHKINQIGAGINIKNYSEKISGYSGNVWLADIGFLYKGVIENLDAGVSILNLGSKIKLNRYSEDITRIYSAGLKYSLFRFDILADLKKTGELSPKCSLGLNFRFDDNFHLMAGFNGTKNINNSVSFGFAYFYNSIGIQYAYDNYSKIGDLHFITLSMSFKPVLQALDKKTDMKQTDIDAEPSLDSNMKNELKKSSVDSATKKTESIENENAEPELKLDYETLDIDLLKIHARKSFESKQYDLAEIILKKIVYNQPDDIETLKFLGDVYYEMKDYDNAIKCYDRVQKFGIKE
ncbi:MAG TPA: hypothetical protein PKY81_00625 [bacterium]|nr:hypothetical protein [bacterium]HPN29437.1 hypothetical protein [bacterium]